MNTQKNFSSSDLFAKAKNVFRKNSEVVSHLKPDFKLSDVSPSKTTSKFMTGGYKNVNKLVKIGTENYKNLKTKTPVLGKNGNPLELKIMGKTYFRIYKPDFNETYIPKKGFENFFIHPDDEMSGKQRLLSRKRGKGTQKGGNPAMGGMAIFILVLGILAAFNGSGVGVNVSSNNN